MPDFRLPDLGEGLTEGEIVNWLVDVGDQVTIDQPVVEVETAKAVVEVPCPYAGVITARHGREGEKLAVGAVLLTVGEVSSEYSGNVLIGYGTSEPTRRSRRTRRGAAISSQSPTPETVVPPRDNGDRGPEAGLVDRGPEPGPGDRGPEADLGDRGPEAGLAPAVISPIVRQLARENGLSLTAIRGTGPGGVIRRADVERELATAKTASAPTQPAATTAGTAAAPGTTTVARRIPLRGLRGAVAEKLATSRREIPEATVWVDVDATGLLAARAALPDVSLLALLARFTVLGLRKFPELNSRVDQDEIAVLDQVHLGFAAQTDRGLVVPVVKDAHTLTTTALARAITDLATQAREGRIPPAALTGGTFTVNNYGVFGVDGSAAIINHPEAAILGIGRIIDRPWAVDGQLQVRKVAQLTLAFDHRVCDGGTAGGFLRFVADCVENPITALGEL
ncbi:dihydrolipoamide acetyltransferase family protein [Saccharothrix variisporea]|uniref:Dihydrolipoamide acetyltransferase component of pyruvate dehydrogenase complex n=1 Tax=Saccharothrix variisporea TaxID=543527 RepID=A0A495XJ53_9PSEU|nr:dihydrolipoamide acetyltransferase family protein [Saccharothrix variisporea]RKT74107.1 pyruvate dehydrogenase E2 component (dihydrolipoamide acetyltransferase) [Saccharothrix variisporea]